MSVRVLFSAPKSDWEDYREVLAAAVADLAVNATFEHAVFPDNPEAVDYIVYAPSSRLSDFGPFTGAKAVLNLWAGVENVVTNPTLTQPLARMVDPGLTEGMVEWCVAHVMRHHLMTDRDVCRSNAAWEPFVPPLARDRPVTILGLGALGRAVGQALAALNFPVTGWSRSEKSVDGMTCLAGETGLRQALATAEILVLLLPLTPETEDLLDADRLALLPKGAVVINPGRGPLIDDGALIAALDKGDLAHATLDVFRTEPLPESHPFWTHLKVTVTPHIASATRPESAARVIAENIRRGEAGEPLLHLVDRKKGY
ncbi:MAG: glyoxylate/hydroxypyruvate reductase A [Silicimonas sp.]|nr:glyoxylate/hydroxypyruvate reductase A [Silicimonas sp.]